MLCGIGDDDKKEVLIDKDGTGGELLMSGDEEEDWLLCDGDGGGHGCVNGADDKLLCKRGKGEA